MTALYKASGGAMGMTPPQGDENRLPYRQQMWRDLAAFGRKEGNRRQLRSKTAHRSKSTD